MARRVHRRSTALVAVLASTALALSACGGDGGNGDEGDGGAVTVWVSLDQTIVDGLVESVTEKAEEAGIEIDIERVDGIDQLIMTRLAANNPPDIAFIPQPGVIAQIVDMGAALPLDDVLDLSALESSMVPGTLDAGKVDDTQYSVLVSMNVKSLLYYPKKAFEEAGYALPETLDELTALAEEIKADGGTPWCLTMESGGATGWVATDWFEDLVMRFGTPDDYRDWVAGDLAFDSPIVREAAAYFEEVAFTEGNVLGGRRAITATPFGDAARPMFADGGPQCWLLKQGSFFVASDFLPEAVIANVDDELGVTYFPPATVDGERPVLGAGDSAVLFSDSDDAATAMQILSESDIGNAAAPASSFLSPHTDFDVSLYPNETQRSIAEIAYDSSQFLFDGSDVMPAEVGAGTFWTQMTAWITDDTSLDDALSNIDSSWP